MAIFYLRVRTFGRSQGKRGSKATSAAAYRSGERIRDERTGNVYDHRRRRDVIHKEIVLPAQLAAQRARLAWAHNRATLWNAAEHAERYRNSRVAREFVVALPHELAPAARTQLALQFARNIADRYRSAVDLAIHAPRGDARNFHAHLLATTREITPDGLGSKTTLELSGTRRYELGLPRWREEIRSLREHWAGLTNAALEHAHVATRVTHLTLAERGLAASDAPPRLPTAAYHMERRGERSFIAEKIRERHRAGLERSNVGPDKQVLGRTDSGRALDRSRERSLTGLQSVLRGLSGGVRAVWRELQGKFGAEAVTARKAVPALELNSGPPGTAAGSIAASERSREQPHRIGHPAERRAEIAARSTHVHALAAQSARSWIALREKHPAAIDAAAQSARNWAAQREKQNAMEASGLSSRADGSRRDDASKLAAEQRSRGPEGVESSEREYSRRHGNGFSL